MPSRHGNPGRIRARSLDNVGCGPGCDAEHTPDNEVVSHDLPGLDSRVFVESRVEPISKAKPGSCAQAKDKSDSDAKSEAESESQPIFVCEPEGESVYRTAGEADHRPDPNPAANLTASLRLPALLSSWRRSARRGEGHATHA